MGDVVKSFARLTGLEADEDATIVSLVQGLLLERWWRNFNPRPVRAMWATLCNSARSLVRGVGSFYK